MRRLMPVALVAMLVAIGVVLSRRQPAPLDAGRMTFVAIAHQPGPVGYRDPAGAISPDGRWIAYSEGRFLRVRTLPRPWPKVLARRRALSGSVSWIARRFVEIEISPNRIWLQIGDRSARWRDIGFCSGPGDVLSTASQWSDTFSRPPVSR